MKNPTILDIKRPIAADLEKFQTVFESIISSDAPLLNRVLRYMIKNKGKQLRPIFVLLSAQAAHGVVSDKAHVGAALVEILHSATLIHDDVVDQADHRRHMFSVPALWKSKVSILVGDYLLGAGLKLAVDNEAYSMLKELSLAVEEMSKGELIQLERSRTERYDKDVYYKVIEKKTAALLAAACAIGSHSSDHEDYETIRRALFAYGLNLGMAFQIKDDLFDYGKRKIGKPRGIDIKEKKLTLPLIYTLNEVDNRKKKWIINSIKKHNRDKSIIKEIISLVKETGGLEYAIEKMNYFHKIALEDLNKLPDNEFKSSLTEMINYVIQRDF